MNPLFPQHPFYRLGKEDAQKKRYPLYAVLILAENSEAALQYRKGWGEETGTDIRAWRDGKKW